MPASYAYNTCNYTRGWQTIQRGYDFLNAAAAYERRVLWKGSRWLCAYAFIVRLCVIHGRLQGTSVRAVPCCQRLLCRGMSGLDE